MKFCIDCIHFDAKYDKLGLKLNSLDSNCLRDTEIREGFDALDGEKYKIIVSGNPYLAIAERQSMGDDKHEYCGDEAKFFRSLDED